MSYVKYRPSFKELGEIKHYYWEVWKGLPNLPFEEANSSGGFNSLVHIIKLAIGSGFHQMH